jgi:hypothetical protein
MASGTDEAEEGIVTHQQRGLRERLGMTGALNSCVGYGCLAIAAVFVLAAVTALCNGTRP